MLYFKFSVTLKAYKLFFLFCYMSECLMLFKEQKFIEMFPH